MARTRFAFSGNWRRDTVADFENGVDKLDLSALGLKGAGESDADAFAKLTLVQDGSTTIITVTGDTRNDIRLSYTNTSEIDVSDFDLRRLSCERNCARWGRAGPGRLAVGCDGCT